MSITDQVRNILREVLQMGERANDLEADTPLLGNIPELDSMAVATLITSIEEQFDVFVDDDDISAETFENFGSLCRFVEDMLAE